MVAAERFGQNPFAFEASLSPGQRALVLEYERVRTLQGFQAAKRAFE